MDQPFPTFGVVRTTDLVKQILKAHLLIVHLPPVYVEI